MILDNVHQIDNSARLKSLRADPMHPARYVDVVVLRNHVSSQMAGGRRPNLFDNLLFLVAQPGQ
jgi:hypothetical protein